MTCENLINKFESDPNLKLVRILDPNVANVENAKI